MKYTKEMEIKDKKVNTKIYPIYKMFSWDLLFYYSIIYLFLVQVKQFSPSQVLLGEAMYTIFSMFLQIPAGRVIDKFGKKNSLIFGNVCISIFAFMLIFIKSFDQLVLAYFMCAVGYVIKGICESNILYESLPRGKKRGSLYSKIDSRGSALYYVTDAITATLAGFSYVINPYLPIILCFVVNVISTIISCKFKHTNIKENKEESIGIKEYRSQLKTAFRFVKKSKRIFCLLAFNAIFAGLLYNLSTLRSSVLEEINLPAQYFGIVTACVQVAASLSSLLQHKIHNKFKNKTLAVLSIPVTVSCILIGFLGSIQITTVTTLIIISLFILQGSIKGPYYVLIGKYTNNFTNRQIRVKLTTIKNLSYNIVTATISIICSILLGISSSATTILMVGCLTTIGIILLLDYMRGKVGLKPEQYSKEDIKYGQNL